MKRFWSDVMVLAVLAGLAAVPVSAKETTREQTGETTGEVVREADREADGEATGISAGTEAAVDEVVAAVMAEKHIPGLALAVLKDGEVILEKGYGFDSVERRVPMTPETVLPIASVSKIFAGTLAMQLVEEGKLDLDASIATWLPDVPDDKTTITVRHLLSHTHGLEDFYHSEKYQAMLAEGDPTTDDKINVRWSLAQPLKTRPGEVFSYSLAGYIILREIFEIVGGEPFPDMVRSRIFEPAGMSDAVYGGSDVIVPGRYPVTYEWKDGALAYHRNDFPSDSYAAGGLNISARGMAAFFRALEAGTLVSDVHRDEMWRAYPVLKEEQRFYGLGWFSYRRNKDDAFVVGHEGGGSSWLVHLPEAGLTIIAFSNLSGARADGLPHEISYLLKGK